MTNKKNLIVVDSNSLIHRAFHALPPLKTKQGELVNAVYGFLLIFFRAVKDLSPDCVAACFDYPAPTFRHKEFEDYKAERPPTPEELKPQISYVKEVLRAFNVPVLEKEGFEADDLIGSITEQFSKKRETSQLDIVVVTGDLDLLQLVNDKVKVYLLKRGTKSTVLFDREKVKEKYSGLTPSQLDDLRALKGDASDNIPGVSGIGKKTAIKFLNQSKTVEELYRRLEEGEKIKGMGPKTKNTLLEQKERALLSKRLAEVKKDIEVGFSIEDCHWGDFDQEKIADLFREFNFETLIKRLPEIKGGGTIKQGNLFQ